MRAILPRTRMARPAKAATRLWIARHGQTESNRAGLFCGHSETSLTELGRAQARALGDRLRDVAFAAAYTSDFSRAIATAVYVLGERDIDPKPDPALREIHYGEWEMKREPEVRRTWPEQHALLRAEDPAWHPPGGETTAMVRARTFAALQRIARRHRHQDVLVVSHGTAIQCMLSEVLGMSPAHVFRFEVANCGLSVVELRGEKFVVTALNETAHLAGIATPEGAAT